MNKVLKNRGTGAGGAKTNEHGLTFEKKVFLKDLIESQGYELHEITAKGIKTPLYKVMKGGIHIGYYGLQNAIYKALKLVVPDHFTNKYLDTVFSKRIRPDSFIISLQPLQLTIFEKKWQQVSGSVDEKLETAPYKLHMFEKLLRGTNINCQYRYILSEHFRKPQYRNIREYYKSKANYKAKGTIKLIIENDNLHTLKIDDYFQ